MGAAAELARKRWKNTTKAERKAATAAATAARMAGLAREKHSDPQAFSQKMRELARKRHASKAVDASSPEN